MENINASTSSERIFNDSHRVSQFCSRFAVRAKADFASGFVSITQLNEKSTLFPERDDLVMKTVNDYCYLKHDEQIILSKSISYRIEFPASTDIDVTATCSVKGKRAASLETPANKLSTQNVESTARDFFHTAKRERKEQSDTETNLLDGRGSHL